MALNIKEIFTWRWIHSFLGLWCSIIFVFIFLTGTLSVLATEIDWLFNPDMRVSAEGREKGDLAQTYGAAKAALGDREIYRVYRDGESFIADLVEFQSGDGLRLMHVDPYTGAVTGESSPLTFNEIIGELHATLFIPTKAGIMIVTVFSLALTGAVIAGAFMLPRFWGSFVIRPRFEGSARALTSDLHRLFGAWLLPFLALMCATSVYYFAETLNLDAPPLARGVETEPRDTKQPKGLDQERISEAMAAAKAVYPDLEIVHILLPRNRVQPIKIEGHLSATLVRERANTVYLHPETLDVIKSHRGEDLSAHQRISEAVDPLHWGYWGGLPSKIVWFVFGLLLTSLPLLGAVIFAKRMGLRRRKLEAREISDTRVYWDGMGLGKWGALGLVAIGLALTVKTIFLG